MEPFKLTPAYKDYIWGGTNLKTHYHKQTNLPVVAESWEVSAHEDGPSQIAGGPFAGMYFNQFVHQHPEAVGDKYNAQQGFPVLVKLIDAQKSLSIQVHPGDEYARRVEHDAGKTEMWIVLHSEPGAFLYVGFNKPTTKAEMEQRIQNDTLTEILHKQPVKKGDVVYIPAGTIHAIGAGIVLAEVQQSSNATYRVYDFGRLGADGKPRPLHVQKALDVTDTNPANPTPPGAMLLKQTEEYTLSQLAKTEFFTVQRLELSRGGYAGQVGKQSFVALLCTSGDGELECGSTQLLLAQGESAFIPAGAGSYTLQGQGSFLLISV